MNRYKGNAIADKANNPVPIASGFFPENFPIAVNAPNNKVIAPANSVRAVTLAIEVSIPLIKDNIPINTNNGPAIAIKAAIPFREFPKSFPIPSRILSAPAIANNNVDNATAEPIADSGSIPCNTNMTPANKPTTTVKVIIGAIGTLLRPFKLLIISANAAIVADRAAADPANFLVSINDKAAIAPAITPIAIAIIMIAPLAF